MVGDALQVLGMMLDAHGAVYDAGIQIYTV